MKKEGFINLGIACVTALLCLAAVSCGKEGVGPGRQDAGTAGTRVDVVFSIPGSSVKSMEIDDSWIGSIDVLAFRPDGLLDAHVRMISPSPLVQITSATASLSAGIALNWKVVANAPDGLLDDVSSESGFNAVRMQLADQKGMAFVMQASGTSTFPASAIVPVDLTRVCSKVSLGSVRAAFKDAGTMSDVRVTLDRVWLLNVCTQVPLTGTAEAGAWRNALVREPLLEDPLATYLVKDLNLVLGTSAPYSLEISFYCCPNPTGTDTDSRTSPMWSPRHTRLVLELSIGGMKNYYPVTLPAMLPNYEYAIEELVMESWGSDHPDKEVRRHSVAFSVTVNPWGSEESVHAL